MAILCNLLGRSKTVCNEFKQKVALTDMITICFSTIESVYPVDVWISWHMILAWLWFALC